MERKKSEKLRKRYMSIDTSTGNMRPPSIQVPTCTSHNSNNMRTMSPTQIRKSESIVNDNKFFNIPQNAACYFLEYGMVVTLMCMDRFGLLTSEGLATDTVRLEKIISTSKRQNFGNSIKDTDLYEENIQQLVKCHYKDCLFEVCLMESTFFLH